jgi:hypothetical protein
MLPRKLRPLTVTLQDAAGKDAPPARSEGTLTVQPIIPGALVTPALADISTAPGSTARFTVLPLATGKLRDARVELRFRGKNVETTALSIKATRRCFAKCLFVLAILVTGLLAWDRHVSRWDPYYAREDLEGFNPMPPNMQGTAGAAGAVLPPPPKEGEERGPKVIPYRGEKAIALRIADNYKSSSERWISGNAEIKDVFYVCVGTIDTWRFGGEWSEGQDQSIFIWGYNLWQVLRNIPMAEVYVGVLLVGLAALVWFMTGASRSRATGRAFELAVS